MSGRGPHTFLCATCCLSVYHRAFVTRDAGGGETVFVLMAITDALMQLCHVVLKGQREQRKEWCVLRVREREGSSK